MANRNFANGGKIMSMHVAPVLVNAGVVIGASGAVSSVTGTQTLSATHVSTGIYQINLTDNFHSALFVSAAMQSPSSGLSGISSIEIQNAPTSSVSVLGSASITVKCLGASGAVADPASGSTISMLLLANNSSVKA